MLPDAEYRKFLELGGVTGANGKSTQSGSEKAVITGFNDQPLTVPSSELQKALRDYAMDKTETSTVRFKPKGKGEDKQIV